jgi:hypothetical protein
LAIFKKPIATIYRSTPMKAAPDPALYDPYALAVAELQDEHGSLDRLDQSATIDDGHARRML